MSRPRRDIEPTPKDKMITLVGISAIMAMLGLVAYYYPSLPDEIPTHFDALGKPDGTGDKSSLLFLSAIGSLSFAFMLFLTKFPHTFNYPFKITEENAEIQYTISLRLIRTIATTIALVFCYLVFVIIQTALGVRDGMSSFSLPLLLLAIFLPIILYMRLMYKFK